MSFFYNNDFSCCKICGRCGVTTRTCPDLSHRKCTYCQQNTHYIHDCPKLQPCVFCKKKGHKSENCQEKQLQFPRSGAPSQFICPALSITAGIKRKRGAKNNYKSESTISYLEVATADEATIRTTITSIKPPAHNSANWFAFRKEIREVIVILISNWQSRTAFLFCSSTSSESYGCFLLAIKE